jgi:hypothetical protein
MPSVQKPKTPIIVDDTEARFRAALTRALSGPYVPPGPSSKAKALMRKTKPRR